MRLNKAAYKQMIDEDIAYLMQGFASCERAHIKQVLEHSILMLYGTDKNPLKLCSEHGCNNPSQSEYGRCMHCEDLFTVCPDCEGDGEIKGSAKC